MHTEPIPTISITILYVASDQPIGANNENDTQPLLAVSCYQKAPEFVCFYRSKVSRGQTIRSLRCGRKLFEYQNWKYLPIIPHRTVSFEQICNGQVLRCRRVQLGFPEKHRGGKNSLFRHSQNARRPLGRRSEARQLEANRQYQSMLKAFRDRRAFQRQHSSRLQAFHLSHRTSQSIFLF